MCACACVMVLVWVGWQEDYQARTMSRKNSIRVKSEKMIQYDSHCSSESWVMSVKRHELYPPIIKKRKDDPVRQPLLHAGS
jgi:hypothetical protein